VQLVQRGRERFGVAQHFAELVLQDLGVEELLGVFPLIQRLGFIEAFIALQADQLQAAPCGDRLGEFGLADAGRPFDQDRFFDLLGQIDRGRNLAVGDVARRGQSLFDGVDGGCGLIFGQGRELRKGFDPGGRAAAGTPRSQELVPCATPLRAVRPYQPGHASMQAGSLCGTSGF